MKQLKSAPTDQEMLEVYALFKQATVGDVNTGMWGGGAILMFPFTASKREIRKEENQSDSISQGLLWK